jgi:hypothetical protein
MARLIVILGFAAFCCFVLMHFAPSTTAIAFTVPMGKAGGSLPVSWLMLAAFGFCYMGKRMTGK